MSVQEILETIDRLPPDQRQQLYSSIDERRGLVWIPEYQHQPQAEETPEEVERIRALLDEGLAELDRGEGTEWNLDEFLAEADQRHQDAAL